MIRHLFTALLFIFFLFFGYQAGIALGTAIDAKSDRPADAEMANLPYSSLVNLGSSTSNSSPAVTLPNGQRSILLIGADDLESGSPRLESIWLVSYVASATRLTFLPVYPTGNSPASSSDLPGLFGFIKEEGRFALNPDFLNALRGQTPWWSSYIVFDTVSLMGLIGNSSESLGKEESNPQELQIPPHAWVDPQAAQAGQAVLYQEMCWQASANGSGLEIEDTIRQYPDRFLSDRETDQLVIELVKLSEHIGAYACEFPTLNPR